MSAMTKNWLYHLQEVGVSKHTLIIGESPETCNTLAIDHIPHCFADNTDWMKKKFIRMGRQVVLKWWYAKKMIDLGYSIIFMDNDVVVLQNPLNDWDLQKQSGFMYDLQALSDHQQAIYNKTHKMKCPLEKIYNSKETPCASTGIWFAESNNRTKNFFNNMVDSINENSMQWEQAKFNHLVPMNTVGFGDEYPPLRFRLLPLRKYANIRVFHYLEDMAKDMNIISREPWGGQVCIHAGYIHGQNEKSNLFKDIGLWKPELFNWRIMLEK